MGWKKKPYNYKWNHNNIDLACLDQWCAVLLGCAKPRRNDHKSFHLLIYYVYALQRNIRIGSILVDLDYTGAYTEVEALSEYAEYDKMVEALEALYSVADIGTLMQDHIERQRKEDVWLGEKGFKNVSTNTPKG